MYTFERVASGGITAFAGAMGSLVLISEVMPPQADILQPVTDCLNVLPSGESAVPQVMSELPPGCPEELRTYFEIPSGQAKSLANELHVPELPGSLQMISQAELIEKALPVYHDRQTAQEGMTGVLVLDAGIVAGVVGMKVVGGLVEAGVKKAREGYFKDRTHYSIQSVAEFMGEYDYHDPMPYQPSFDDACIIE